MYSVEQDLTRHILTALRYSKVPCHALPVVEIILFAKFGNSKDYRNEQVT